MSKRIFLAAGGTGGHVFPAFATAEVLLDQGHDLYWVTDARGLKYKHHWQGKNTPLETQAASPANKIKFALKMGVGFIQSFVHLLKHKPDVVLGFGGYPSVPIVLAAQIMGIPTLVHEANATIGLANRFLGKNSKAIAVSFPDKHPKAVLTGNPVRPAIAALAERPFEMGDQLDILVFGGSLGATIFETIIPSVMERLSADLRKRVRLTQQVVDDTARAALTLRYKNMGVEAALLPFVEDMQAALETAHLVICRSGASTVAELTAVGRPAVFIPYAFHGDNQQYANARAAADAGGAILLDEKHGAEQVTGALQAFLAMKPDWTAMASAMKNLGKPTAAWTLSELVVKTAV